MANQKISWGEHPRQHIEVFNSYDSSKEDAIVFIHGGGWVQESEKAIDYLQMAECLSFDANMFGVEYRVSPEVKDPFHLLDVLHGLEYIFKHFKIKRLHLVGHSVGAFLCLQIQDHTALVKSGLQELVKADIISKKEEDQSLYFLNQLSPLFAKVELINVIYLSGVYDIPLGVAGAKQQGLSIEEMNGYSYVFEAFVSPEHYTNASQVSSKKIKEPFNEVKAKGKHVILHSVVDEYVRSNQPLNFTDFFYQLKKPVELYIDNYGPHHNILKIDEAFKLISRVLNETSDRV